MRLLTFFALLLPYVASAQDLSALVFPDPQRLTVTTHLHIRAVRHIRASEMPCDFGHTCSMGLRTIGDQDSIALWDGDEMRITEITGTVSGLAEPHTTLRITAAAGETISHLTLTLPGDRRLLTYRDLAQHLRGMRFVAYGP
jgi:hypothetical protein